MKKIARTAALAAVLVLGTGCSMLGIDSELTDEALQKAAENSAKGVYRYCETPSGLRGRIRAWFQAALVEFAPDPENPATAAIECPGAATE